MEVEKKVVISSESDFEIKLTDEGMAELVLSYGGKLGGAKITAFMDAVMLVDKITDMIPGDWDDKLLDDLAAKLLKKKSV